ncbi:MAG: low molecular weight phosphotyrosine protein phosphatase [Hoeflea sp.]|nr:low molecular weight phosphotyrosine protein phosphatase [Alphaproteobacteria bacterium]MBV1725149.1 low molecular weight phosphotyrosine protein phosphatase [Hoeflea sp.]MBU4544729.1 low molecular weight phosphotyrosine protein phosphatase [Alphaproteobacteria bacterium]MBU4552960.1 low molecular weight phosphotyrosine protein phosphatase [Alphaproteobacteria bacterium]MBV1761169.1 low molecular weight phosphotyrosine protein phosphatase [Hoeflea sp.]
MGNICRSPLAEGILRQALANAGLGSRVFIDSAGTGNWHQGDTPDPRSIETASGHGLDISAQRARQVEPADFDRFDLIFAMDRSNEATLRARSPSARHGRIKLFLEYALGTHADVPDPYYGGEDGFEDVYQLLREGCTALVARLGRELRQPSG